MRILRVEVEGYRSLRRISWNPGALNVIIGPNGAGKSNLGRALYHLSRAARLGSDFADTLAQAGGLLSILWNGESERVRWCLQGAPDGGDQREINYEMSIQAFGPAAGQGSSTTAGHSADRSGHWQIGLERLTRATDTGPIEVFSRTRTTPLPQLRSPEKKTGQREGAAGNNRAAALSKRALDPLQPWLAWLPLWLGNEQEDPYSDATTSIRSWQFHPHLPGEGSGRGRGPQEPERGAGDEYQELAALLLRLYGSDIEFRREFDRCMIAAFEDYQGLCIDPHAGSRTGLGVKWRSLRPMALGELSVGTLRYMHLLALLRAPGPHRLIWLDEPEMGLHPTMFPLLAESAHAASQVCQVAIATHSIEMLRCLGAYRPQVTKAQLIDGHTELDQIEMAEVEQWVGEYGPPSAEATRHLPDGTEDALATTGDRRGRGG